jgi:hypothetical protein
MPKARNYAAEYAARKTRAQAAGFRGYGQARYRGEKLRADLMGLQKRGIIDLVPEPRSKGWKTLMAAEARLANKGFKFVPGKPKLTVAQVRELRRMYPSGGEFYSAMRRLYRQKGRR